ncbi:MAG TPA: alpha amylase C-terminal domain-containing protein, partial [Candidatus Xenobia bacterium]
LGFGYKWDMGWMNDTLKYFQFDPVHRKYHHNLLTFRGMYQYAENYVLPLSHDEVVHLKGSLLSRMPGDVWQKFANLRLLLGYMMAYPGKKLLFMGAEFGQWKEFNEATSLEWYLLGDERHRQMQDWSRAVTRLYRDTPALHETELSASGFEWVDCNDAESSIISFLRFPEKHDQAWLFVFNFTPVPRLQHNVALPWGGKWQHVLSSDDPRFGGSGLGLQPTIEADAKPLFGRSHTGVFEIPPLGLVIYQASVEAPRVEHGGTKDAAQPVP